MRVPLFLFFVLLATFLFGQSPVDSLAIVKQVDSLVTLNRDLMGKRQFEEGLVVIDQAENLALSAFGRESAAFGACRHNHARSLLFLEKWEEAELMYKEVISIRAKVLGRMNAEYARSLHGLANTYIAREDYSNAEPLLFEEAEIWAHTVGKESPDYANAIEGLAYLYNQKGDYANAGSLYQEVLDIRAKSLGKEHPEYMMTLVNLAQIYSICDNHSRAESLFFEAIASYAKIYGKEHPNYIWSMRNLAVHYRKKGDYVNAELLYLKIIEIFKVVAKDDPYYAVLLTDLGTIYLEQGNYSKAESLYLEALEIRAKILGKEHIDYLGSLINLGNLYQGKDEYDKAVSYYLEARNIFENVLHNKEHQFYHNCLKNLGNNYIGKHEYDKAELLILEANNLRANEIGDTLNLAFMKQDLAYLYLCKGNYAKAEALYFEAKEIIAKRLGKECPDYELCLSGYAKTQRMDAAAPVLLELIYLDHLLINRSAAYLSENQMYAYIQKFTQQTNFFYSFLYTHRRPELLGPAYDNTLFFNGFLLENARHLASSINLITPALRDTFELWQGCRRRLADEYAKHISERRLMASVEAEAEGYEKTLTRNVSAFAKARKQQHWNEIRDRLHTGEAAIEFIRFQFIKPDETDSVMYAAFVLHPDCQEPQFIPLFEEKQLNNLVKNSGARKADYVNGVYGNQKTTEKSLYKLLWQPLEKDLAGIQTIYFSPSGLLHRLNLNAIPINDKETLSDRYHLVELGSTRQLVISSESKNSITDSGQALLFGGVQYDLNSDSIASQNIDIESSITGARGDLNFSYTDSTDRGGTWNYLKWTEKEVTTLEPILQSAQIQTTVRKGYTATEEALKSIGSTGTRSPRILHIATHGYFFPDPKESTKGSASGLGTEPVFKLSDHPMIRSGLILAGGNHAWKSGKPYREGMEDGILTAYEISQMDLSNTELVVLSACETGLGDIQGNEGVYGLQRAFKIAGAKYLIMSLWQVPDFQTQELMTAFYTNWLTKQMAIPDAFRAAQQAMREKYEHPYFWAGFVLVE